MVNYEEALKKPITDLGKLVLGIILSIIPIIQLVAYGFAIECSGVGKNKPSKNMPVWKDYLDYFVKGLLSVIIMVIYALPAIILFSIGVGYAAISMITTIVGIMPQDLLNSLMAGQVAGTQLEQFFSQNWMMMLPTLAAATPVILLGLVLLLVAAYVSPIAVLNYLKNKGFGKAFDFGAVFSKALTLKYFTIWIVAGVISVVLNAVLAFIPWIGSAIAFFVSGVITWSLYGQVFREK
jgi:hypothetical protein